MKTALFIYDYLMTKTIFPIFQFDYVYKRVKGAIISYFRDGEKQVRLCVTAVETECLDPLQRNLSHRFFRTKSLSSSLVV